MLKVGRMRREDRLYNFKMCAQATVKRKQLNKGLKEMTKQAMRLSRL